MFVARSLCRIAIIAKSPRRPARQVGEQDLVVSCTVSPRQEHERTALAQSTTTAQMDSNQSVRCGVGTDGHQRDNPTWVASTQTNICQRHHHRQRNHPRIHVQAMSSWPLTVITGLPCHRLQCSTATMHRAIGMAQQDGRAASEEAIWERTAQGWATEEFRYFRYRQPRT